MNAPLTRVNWSNHYQWDFMVRDRGVLELWETTGEVEPKRIFAWALDHLDNYQQFLLVILQKYHKSSGALPQVVWSIIAVQNAFARAQLTKTENVVETD